MLLAPCYLPPAPCPLLLKRPDRPHRIRRLLVALALVAIGKVDYCGAVLSFFGGAPVIAFVVGTEVLAVLVDDVQFIF